MTATDDSDRAAFSGSYAECFDCDGVGDRDPMYDDAPIHGYKCGRDGNPCCLDFDGKFVGPGCRHCNPVDYECKPYGFGFETFECERAQHIRREMLLLSAWGHPWPFSIPDSYGLALKWAGFNFRLAAVSDRVWDLICCRSETHTEALAVFAAWAGKVSSATARRKGA